ncbi:MAG: hypothetical protein KAR42_16165 [candidate division Zixibacteria bacterium]|nr:hypothetical protein [candidate division Zixibacteria bacterium]
MGPIILTCLSFVAIHGWNDTCHPYVLRCEPVLNNACFYWYPPGFDQVEVDMTDPVTYKGQVKDYVENYWRRIGVSYGRWKGEDYLLRLQQKTNR